jgi:hypothetical protein
MSTGSARPEAIVPPGTLDALLGRVVSEAIPDMVSACGENVPVSNGHSRDPADRHLCPSALLEVVHL